MSGADQHMDAFFRKAAGEQQFPYKAEFWNDVEAQLNDASLDDAFKTAAGSVVVMPEMDLSEMMRDAFMDDAFKDAAANLNTLYPANAWNLFQQERAALEQDLSFQTAANSITADYHPVFWTDADQALQNEGLHYEYKAAYWNDARNLLDNADRKTFFFRWSAVAAVLLLLSFGGLYQSQQTDGDALPLTADALSSQNSQGTHTNQTRAFEALSANLHTHSVETSHAQENLVSRPVETDHLSAQTTAQRSDAVLTTGDLITTNLSDRSAIAGNPLLNNTPETSLPETTQPVESNLAGNDNPSATVNSLSGINETLDETTLQLLPANHVNGLNPEVNDVYAGPEIEIQRFKLNPTHTLSFTGNAGVGNRYGEASFTPSFRTSFGIEYKRTGFGRLRNVEFGGSLSMHHVRQNNFGTERRVSVFNVQGGVDKFWYKLQFKDMIYANASGIATYRLDGRNSVRLSFGVDYLVFAQSNMSYKVNADEGITTVNNNWGVKDGLSKVDLRLGLGYEFNITPRFAVQLNSSFGFFDRSDDAFITKNFFDHEMNATLGLKYTFLRKL